MLLPEGGSGEIAVMHCRELKESQKCLSTKSCLRNVIL